MIVTFYSYRGGVGRSMAMANVGEILADLGYRVILCDWDLEAPGLERYFVGNGADDDRYRREMDEFLRWPGLVDLLREYKELLSQPDDGAAGGAKNCAAQPAADGAADAFADVGGLRVRRPSMLARPLPTAGERAGWLRLLSAGRRDGDALQRYGDEVRRFDWQEFYERWAGDAYIDFFRHDLVGDPKRGLAGCADIVLIDSRTGVTEQGGICTHHLADLVVLVTAANDLNMEGAKWMAHALADPGLVARRGGRALQVLPVASRIEQTAQRDELVDFRQRFLRAFAAPMAAVVENPEAFALAAEIPYMPFYAFHERVVAREPESGREQRLYAAYRALAESIVGHGVNAALLRTPTARGIIAHGRPQQAGWDIGIGAVSQWVRVLGEGLQSRDNQTIDAALEGLERAILAGATPDAVERQVLIDLYRAGRHDALERLAGALLRAGTDQPFVHLALARAQVGQGQLSGALSTLQTLAANARPGSPEQREGRALNGSVHRQLYLAAVDPRAPASVRSLERAINEYYDLYRTGQPPEPWAALSVVALLKRAAQDGVRLESAPEPQALAHEVLELLGHSLQQSLPDGARLWAEISTIEAWLALDRPDEALRRLVALPAVGSDAAVALATLDRQLVVMWRLRLDRAPGARLLAGVRALQLQLGAGSVEIPVAPLPPPSALALGHVGVGEDGDITRWIEDYVAGLDRARAVLLLTDASGRVVGTATALDGAVLHPAWAGRCVLLTSAQVLATDGRAPDGQALSPRWAGDTVAATDSTASTTVKGSADGFAGRLGTVLFWSAPDQLDAVVIELDGVAAPPLWPVVADPAIDPAAVRSPDDRLCVIGAGSAADQGAALRPARLLPGDAVPRRFDLQFAAAAAGSPVFDMQWRLLALLRGGMSPDATPMAALIPQIARRLDAPAPSAPNEPVRLFISYSPEDERMVEELRRHMRPLERQGLLSIVNERVFVVGQDWSTELSAQIDQAGLIVLAISADFLASDYGYGIEVAHALRRAHTGEARVIPLLLRPCAWEDLPFAQLQVLPRTGQAVSAARDRDEAWTDVVRGLRQAIEAIRAKRAQTKG